jgi:signal transduction histidine kinase
LIETAYQPLVIAGRLAQPATAERFAAEKIRRSGRALKRRIVFFSLVVIAATSILVTALISAQRESALDRARFDASNLSAAFEEQVRQVIAAVSAAVDRFKDDIRERGVEDALQNWMRQPGLETIPAAITVIGADGKVAAPRAKPGLRRPDFSDSEHFRVHASSNRPGVFVGRAREDETGRFMVPLTWRLEKPDGAFDGILLVSLPSEFLTGLYHSLDMGWTGSFMLIGADGSVRAYSAASGGRKSDAGVIAGSYLPDTPALHEANFDAEGAYEGVSRIDGLERLHHWRKVRGYPLIAIVGIGKSEVLEAANRQGAMVLGTGGVTLFLAVLMPLLLHREVSKRIANEIALNAEKAKLKEANDALAEERKNLQAINRELVAEKRRAEQASIAKSTFLMNMSHEFRTPMHAILNYTNLGLRKIDGEEREKLRKYIENTRAAGLRLLRMLNGLLDLAKLEEGKIELQYGEADLMEMIQQTQVELGSLLEEKDLRVAIDVASKNTLATCDSPRLVQVIVNLFSNAIKFSPAGGLISVAISDAWIADGRPSLRCDVSDQGPGIPEGELAKIFDRFIQSSTARKNGGAGLGLTICREIVHLHGGKIWAANGKGGGAIMSFLIPREPPSFIETSPAPAKAGEAARAPLSMPALI